WTTEHAPPLEPAPPPTAAGPAAPNADTELPKLDEAPAPSGQQAQTAPAQAEPAPQASQLVRVRTDVLDAWIDLRGGDLGRVDLPPYPVDKRDPTKVVRLLDFEPDTRWVFQSGLRGTENAPEPNHVATFRSASASYQLMAGENELQVTLDWADGGALK